MGFSFIYPVRTSFMQIRSFLTTVTVNNKEISPSSTPKPQTSGYDQGIRKMTKLSNFQKRILVFSKRFKSLADVPNSVPSDLLQTAQSRARIRLANYLMALTMIGCLSYAYSGRSAAERGESVVQMNIDWHKEYNQRLIEEESKKGGKA